MSIIKKAQRGVTVANRDSIGPKAPYKGEEATGLNKAKNGKWIQKATASITKRGTKGVCTGAKFGGPTCKPGSKRYSLAKTFRKISKKK